MKVENSRLIKMEVRLPNLHKTISLNNEMNAAVG
jgi:hypothetical protein